MNSIKKIILLFFAIVNVAYTQIKQTGCDVFDNDFHYYQLTILKTDNPPIFINLIGENIDFEKVSKDNLQVFFNNVLSKSSFIPVLMSRLYYLKNCNIKEITQKEDLIFIAKFNKYLKKLSKRNKQVLNLTTGEEISIQKMGVKGKFIKIDINQLKYEKSSIYPEDIYDCKFLKEYCIPLEIESYYKLKCLN